MQRDKEHVLHHRTIEREKYVNASPPNFKRGQVDEYLWGSQSICNQGALETEKNVCGHPIKGTTARCPGLQVPLFSSGSP